MTSACCNRSIKSLPTMLALTLAVCLNVFATLKPVNVLNLSTLRSACEYSPESLNVVGTIVCGQLGLDAQKAVF